MVTASTVSTTCSTCWGAMSWERRCVSKWYVRASRYRSTSSSTSGRAERDDDHERSVPERPGGTAPGQCGRDRKWTEGSRCCRRSRHRVVERSVCDQRARRHGLPRDDRDARRPSRAGRGGSSLRRARYRGGAGRRGRRAGGRRGRSLRPAVRLPGLRGGPSVRGKGRGQRGRAPGREPSAPRLRTERKRLVRLDPGRCAFGAGEFGGPGRRCSGSGDRRGGDGRVRYGARGPGAGRRAIPLRSHVKLRVYLDVADPVTRRRLAALVKADPEIALVAEAEEADVVVSERVIATAARAGRASAGRAGPGQQGNRGGPRSLHAYSEIPSGLGAREARRALPHRGGLAGHSHRPSPALNSAITGRTLGPPTRSS